MEEEDTHEDPEWNAALERVVAKEGEQSQSLFWLHNRASIWASRRNDWITIPGICIATITGFFSATSDLVPPVAIGALSVLVGILGTINSYFKYSQRAEGHRIASLLYLKIYKTIETQLSLPVNQRISAETLLKQLQDELTRVSETAPVIPEVVIEAFKQKFNDPKISVALVANGLDPIQIWKQASTTARSPEAAKSPIKITVTNVDAVRTGREIPRG